MCLSPLCCLPTSQHYIENGHARVSQVLAVHANGGLYMAPSTGKAVHYVVYVPAGNRAITAVQVNTNLHLSARNDTLGARFPLAFGDFRRAQKTTKHTLQLSPRRLVVHTLRRV